MQSPPHASAIEEVVQLLDRLDSSEKGDVTATSSKKPRLESGTQQEHSFNVIVAVQQGNILATAFHPELTDDLRWHRSAS